MRLAPGRILAFLYEQTNEVIKGQPINDMDDILAVVATCKYQHNRSSMFTTEWQSEYTYDHQRRKHQRLMLLPVSSFVRQCLMIPYDSHCEIYHEIWTSQLWATSHLNDYY